MVSSSLWLSWQDQVSLSASDDEAVVAGPGARLILRPLRPEIAAAMARLAPPGEDEQRLVESILSAGTVDSLARWYYHLDQLQQRGLIRVSLYSNDRHLATFCPFAGGMGQASRLPGAKRNDPDHTGAGSQRRNGHAGQQRRTDRNTETGTSQYLLSRFAYLRREDEKIIVESPLSHGRVILHDSQLLSVLGELASPRTLADLVQRQDDRQSGLDADDINSVIQLLQEANIVERIQSGAAPASREEAAENAHDSLECWEFHDLLFHSRSRRGRSDGRFGGTFRFPHRPPPPALKPICSENGYELYRPDLQQLERDDPPLALVQERRRSLREYSNQPLTARQLGEFLYRVARVKGQWQSQMPTSRGPVTLDVAARPFSGRRRPV